MDLFRYTLIITNIENKSMLYAQAMLSASPCSLGAERRGEQLVHTM